MVQSQCTSAEALIDGISAPGIRAFGPAAKRKSVANDPGTSHRPGYKSQTAGSMWVLPAVIGYWLISVLDGQVLGRLFLLRSHLLVNLAHRGNQTRGLIFSPGLEAVCCFFDVSGKELVREPFPSLLNRGLDAIPHPEELAAGFEEQILV